MFKKENYFLCVFIIFCFSAGIFTEIAMPCDQCVLKDVLPPLISSLSDYIKNDILTVFVVMLFSASVFLFPVALFMLSAKIFSLGFTAAYLLSHMESTGKMLLFSVLFPRALFKIPAYIFLLYLGLKTLLFVKETAHHHSKIKSLRPYIHGYIAAFAALVISSLIEVLLLHTVL